MSDVFYLPKLVALWGLLAAVSLLLVVSILKGEVRHRFEWIGVVDAPVVAFVLLILAALAMSTDRRQSLFGEALQHQGVLTTLLYVGFFYVTRLLIRDVSRVLLLFVAVAVGATTVSGYAIVQKLGLDPIWNGRLPAGRVFSTIGQPNGLAAYLVLAIPTTAALGVDVEQAPAFRSARRRSDHDRRAPPHVQPRRLLGVCAGGRGVHVRRQGQDQAAVGRCLRVRQRRDRRDGSCCRFVAPARSAITGLWHDASRVSAVNEDESIDHHLDLWRVAVRIIERHPFVGTGPETFPDQFARYSGAVLPAAKVRYFEQFRVESPHNQVLAVASGAGVPAAVAYLSVLVGVTRTLLRRVSSNTEPSVRLAIVAVLAAGAGHLVTDSFMSAEVTGSWLFWVLAGAGVGIAVIGTAHTGTPVTTALPDGDDVAADRAPGP